MNIAVWCILCILIFIRPYFAVILNQGQGSGRTKRFGENETDTDTREKLSPQLKYSPYLPNPNYNKLQIPSLGYVITTLNKTIRDNLSDELFQDKNVFSHPINVTLRINYVYDLDQDKEQIIFAGDLILEWTDKAICFEALQKYDLEGVNSSNTDPLFKTFDSEFLDQIWKPDIYIENMVKVQHPEVMSPPVTVRLNEVTGQVIFVSRIRVQMECDLDFHYYPADTQKCPVVLKSSAYSSDELTLNWSKPHGVFLQECGGSDYNYKIDSVKEETLDEDYIGNTNRTFSTLSFNIVARRTLSYHIVQTFLPSVFFIIITWLCFLVPSRMVEARIGISMTTLLTLTAMFASIREDSPSVSYVRAIDIWMLSCIFFVFLTLLEFTVLLWLRDKGPPDCAGSQMELKPLNPKAEGEGDDPESVVSVQHPNLNRRKEQKTEIWKLRISEWIEKYSFLTIASGFVIFCIIFWAWLLLKSKYSPWIVDQSFNCVGEDEDDEEDE